MTLPSHRELEGFVSRDWEIQEASQFAYIEARYRLLYGFRAPKGQQMSVSDGDRAALVGCGKVLPWD